MRKLMMLGLVSAGAMMFGMENTAKADGCYRGGFGGGFGYPSYSYGGFGGGFYNPGFVGGGFNRGFVGRRSGFSLYIGTGRRGFGGFNRGGFGRSRGFGRGGFGRGRGFGGRRGGFGRRW